MPRTPDTLHTTFVQIHRTANPLHITAPLKQTMLKRQNTSRLADSFTHTPPLSQGKIDSIDTQRCAQALSSLAAAASKCGSQYHHQSRSPSPREVSDSEDNFPAAHPCELGRHCEPLAWSHPVRCDAGYRCCRVREEGILPVSLCRFVDDLQRPVEHMEFRVEDFFVCVCGIKWQQLSFPAFNSTPFLLAIMQPIETRSETVCVINYVHLVIRA